MAERWYDTVLQSDPTDPAALAARTKSLPATDEDPFYTELSKAVDAGMNKNWWSRLPKNIGVGVYKAALNTIETGKDIVNAVETSGSNAQATLEGQPPIAPMNTAPEFFEAAHALADEWTANNTLGDDVAQGIAQFAIPFAAYMRAAGGIQAGAAAVNVVKAVGAEIATAATAFDPHDGRLADLVQMGRESEGRFGELLRTIAPDGSLINNYINWMTDRENEGKWEGRFKNAVDSLAATAAMGGLVKGAATGFRAAKKIAADPPKVGPAAQRGAVGDLTDIERARALKNTEVVEGGEHIVLEGDTLNTNAEVVPLRQPTSVSLYRGTRPGRDPRGTQDTLEGALFYTPDVRAANIYGRYGGDVVNDTITFNKLLEAQNWVEAKSKLGLPTSATMRDLVNAAREAKYDGVTFDTKTGKEYIAIPENLRPDAIAQGRTAPGVADTPEELARLLRTLEGK